MSLPSTNMYLGTVLCTYCVILLLLLYRDFTIKYPAILTLPLSCSLQDPREILLCWVSMPAFVDSISVACLVLVTVILPFLILIKKNSGDYLSFRFCLLIVHVWFNVID